ncbi:hypothetical protein [Clostridium sp. YIM B02500]|uniref:hypothetical protein n=1 Tax=Clostridium sp. YIM B02500 TaxID=2910681 RepID=UPI001EEDBB17|nr:hypothetical protein [Clostridium sp. YIM B02500]
MTEKTLNIKVEDEKGKQAQMVSQTNIKKNIKRYMYDRKEKMVSLSKKANINILKLIYLLYCPFSKVKLSTSIKLCKALNIELSKILN